ncbi:sulfatase [Maribacter chungangensis]|uniref:Sulfatase n=1 Tax=Maribacter chungangensis TaxID=1069117 RepID=A0ABW3B0K8_9FLAO
MLKKYTVLLIIPFFFSCKKSSKQLSESKKQNFVFVLVDDLGWTDLGYSGSTFYETPNIDEFSRASIQFTNAYASASICSPSRAAIVTGKHPARLNITDWLPGDDPKDRSLLGPTDLDALPVQEGTLAEVLKENGYRTLFVGKWHLGGEGHLPEQFGFDKNIGGYHVGQPPGGYHSPYENPYLSDGPAGEYLTDRLTQESMTFLDSIGENPFFIYLNYYTVHTPIQANTMHIERFKDKLENLDSLGLMEREEGKAMTKLAQRNPEYASMVYALDDNLGKLVHKLKAEDLYENTTIIFTSDNGGLSTLEPIYSFEAPTAVVPLRGGKGWLYEGGIRVPLLIKPANYNKKDVLVETPVVGHDFYPTILAQAGVELPANNQIDGKDLSPLLKGVPTLDRDALFWHYPHYHGSGWTPGAAIREGDWKLIEFYEEDRVALYNLNKDLSEQNDLALKYPEKVLELQKKLHDLQQGMGAQMPKGNVMPE